MPPARSGTATFSIGFVKTGLAAPCAGQYIGRLVCADIGIRLCGEAQRICPDGGAEPEEDVLPCPPWLDPAPIDVSGEAYETTMRL